MMKKVVAATAAMSLVSTPVMAQASLADREPALLEEFEQLEGENGILIAILAAAAIIAGIIIIADDDDPTSP